MQSNCRYIEAKEIEIELGLMFELVCRGELKLAEGEARLDFMASDDLSEQRSCKGEWVVAESVQTCKRIANKIERRR